MTRLAAIDLGTNSTRLLVADSDDAEIGGPLSTIERHMHITRLGQGVNAAVEAARSGKPLNEPCKRAISLHLARSEEPSRRRT